MSLVNRFNSPFTAQETLSGWYFYSSQHSWVYHSYICHHLSNFWLQKMSSISYVTLLCDIAMCVSHGDEERQATLMGAMHALVSFIQHAGNNDGSGKTDVLRSISAGSHRFVFTTREHLILVAASSSQTSTYALQLALNYTYNLIISILTYRRMESIFSTRKNYDLRRLLGGVDQFLDSLLDAVETDPCYYLGAVRCLPLDSGIRDLIAQTMAQHCKVKVTQINLSLFLW